MLASILLTAALGALGQQPVAGPEGGVVATAERLVAAGTLDDIQIGASCWSEGPYREVGIHGRGIGIWNNLAQFSVPRRAIDAMLQAFRTADFEHMPAVFGGAEDPDAARRGPKIICQVTLTAGGRTKDVVQRDKGRQSKPLWTLANTILDLSEPLAASGVTASSLEDGLAKVVAGQLAPETLRLTVHHRGIRTAGREPGGWILRVDGRSAIAEVYGGAPDARRVVGLLLTAADLSDLVRTLRTEDAATLPGNLYFPGYTDLSLGVLNREHQIQARQFSGMDPQTRARGQAPFEKLMAALTSLRERVLAEGRPIG